MQFMVTGADGKEYGPTDIATLKTWVAENRLAPHTVLRDFSTGQTMVASSLAELFPPAATPSAPPIGTGYPRQEYSAPASKGDHGGGVLAGVILRSVAAVVLFFFMHGIGLFFAGYAMFYAIRCQQSGSKYGIIAIVIAGIALAAVGIGWMLRLSTGAV